MGGRRFWFYPSVCFKIRTVMIVSLVLLPAIMIVMCSCQCLLSVSSKCTKSARFVK